jgi:hypothetical protein
MHAANDPKRTWFTGRGAAAVGVAVKVGYPGAETCRTLMTSVRSIA